MYSLNKEVVTTFKVFIFFTHAFNLLLCENEVERQKI